MAELVRFLELARLDAIGVFGYSDEDGTEAETFDGKLSPDEIAARVEAVSTIADELVTQRAEDRIGTEVVVLVEQLDGHAVGRAAHQGPDVDGVTHLDGDRAGITVGSLVTARVHDNDGVDLLATVTSPPR